MSQYAKDTAVTVEKSKAEIERTLMRYGVLRLRALKLLKIARRLDAIT